MSACCEDQMQIDPRCFECDFKIPTYPPIEMFLFASAITDCKINIEYYWHTLR